MPPRTVIGTCRVCGAHGPLTYEHVPPRCAFNDEPLRSYKLGQWWLRRVGEPARYDDEQRGAGAYLLCDRCNNHVCGQWYVPELCKWVRAVATRWDELPPDAGPEVVVTVGLRRVYPARFAKQVLAMLLATTPPGFSAGHCELRRLVLERETRSLPAHYQLYLSLFNRDVARQTGIFTALPPFGARPFDAGELSYPPFSYLLTLGEEPAGGRLGNISHFLGYGPDDEAEVRVELPANSTLLPWDVGEPE